MSTSSKPQLTTEQIQKLRAKFTRFRILVIGRANAGKTTILRKLCNTTGEPMIFNPDGEKIESSPLDPSGGRGLHDIENQMIFESASGFVFHDSRGFEAGGAHELKLVQKFIMQRSKERNVNKQLHAIWYCIPTSDDRPITAAEKKFFNECGTGLVPVIVLWTKTDSLDLAKIKQLMKEGNSRSKAIEQAPQKAWADFERNIYPRFEKFQYPPKAYIVFRNMHEPGVDCNDLIEKTTAALSSEELQQILVSTQQNNVQLCIEYGVRRILNSAESTLLEKFKNNGRNWIYFGAIVLQYFPPLRIRDLDRDDFHRRRLDFDFDYLLDLHWEYHDKESIFKIMSFILPGLSTKFNLKEVTYCTIVAAIIGHLAFFLHQESPKEKKSLERAAQVYQQSACDNSIKQAVERIFQLENLFKSSHSKHSFLNLQVFKQSCVDREFLAREAIQAVLDHLIPLKK